ncbi:MAG TPA: AI-2E family transporter, partial [Opitutaceae bacterium]|nr:AI-2E family transporter [Opitutaceae bacterium]
MDGESPLLSQTQKKILGIALGSLGVCAILGIIVFAIILFGWLVGFFAEVIWPLAVSGIIALTLRPSVDFLQRKLKVRRLFAVILLFWAFLMVVTAMILSILPPIIGQIIDLIDYLPALSNSVQDYIYQHYPEWADLVDRYMKNPTIHKFADGISGEFKNLLAHSLPTLKAAG